MNKDIVEWLPGYVTPEGEFHRNPWSRPVSNRENAVTEAEEYAESGNDTLETMGIKRVLRPAVVKRTVTHTHGEPEVCGG